MGVRRWVAAALCVPLLGITGCSDDDPKAEPEDRETPSASTSPTPSGPSIPPEAQGTDEASAKAFVRHWFAVLSEAMRSGDVEPLDTLATVECESCSALSKKIEDLYRKGGRVETEGWLVEQIVADSSQSSEVAQFKLRTRYSTLTLYGEDGAVVSREPEDLIPMEIRLLRGGDAWRVDEAVVLR